MPSQPRLESLFFTLWGLLNHHARMTPDFSPARTGRPGKQHRAEGAGGSGLCGGGEGERPSMQKVQKDQQAGERQDSHNSQTHLLSPPPFFLCSPASHSALFHPCHARPPLPPCTRPLLGGDDRPYRVQRGTLGRLCGEGSVRH